MEKPKEEPKEEPKKDVKFVYYIDGHQAGAGSCRAAGDLGFCVRCSWMSFGFVGSPPLSPDLNFSARSSDWAASPEAVHFREGGARWPPGHSYPTW